jgi:hypothetical protein
MSDHLLNHIGTIIKSFISNYNSKISKKYNLDISELDSLWNEVNSQVNENSHVTLPVSRVEDVVVPPKVSVQPAKKPIVTKPKAEEDTCPYNFTRGPNAGTVCGSKVKGDSSHCSRHKQYEGKELKQKKVLPQAKKLPEDNNSSEEETVRTELKKKIYAGFTDTQITHMFYKKQELGDGLLYHKQTNLVCDNTKFIVGKKDGNKVLPLTEDDIKVAKSWNFKIKSVVETIPKESVNLKICNTIINDAIKSQETKIEETNILQETKPQEIIVQATKPRETKPQEIIVQATKPRETKPQEIIVQATKPQETKPQEIIVQATKPQETKHQEIIVQATKPQETKHQETKHQEIIVQATKPQETKKKVIAPQETKVQEIKKKPILVSAKKFNIPVPQLNVKTIQKAKLPVNDTPVIVTKKPTQNVASLNEEAKNTKKSITNLIEQQKQQKDIEDILENLTTGNDSDEQDKDESELEDEDEINIDDYDEE